MAKISLSHGDKFLGEVALTKERVTIGRKLHNDIVLDDLAISGEHAVIVTLHHDSYLEDLNSTNGTQVNGQPVKKHYLRDEDCIELAQYRIRYESKENESAGDLSVGICTHPRLKVLNGPRAGNEMSLSKALTSIGKPELRKAVILKRIDGFYLAHVEGNTSPLLNGTPLGFQPQKLKDGDEIELDGDHLRFCCKKSTDSKIS